MSQSKEKLYQLRDAVNRAINSAESKQTSWDVALDSVIVNNRMALPHAVSIPMFVWDDFIASLWPNNQHVYNSLSDTEQAVLESDYCDDVGSHFEDLLMDSNWQRLMETAGDETGFCRALGELVKQKQKTEEG